MLPKMVPLGIRIGDMRLAYPLHFFQYSPVGESCPAQFGPIRPFPASDQIVNGSQSELLMGEVTV
jgi:hypothetical protein